MDLHAYQCIFEQSGYEVSLLFTCKWLYHNLLMREPPGLDWWDQPWLESYAMRNIEKFSWWHHYRIWSVGHLRNLRELHVYDACLPQDQISKLNLEYLEVDGTRHFTDISHMKNLKSLSLDNNQIFTGEYGDQKLLEGLTSLEELTVTNTDARDLNHLRRLRELAISWAPYISNAGLGNLNLERLDVDMADQITDVSHMTKLRRLIVRENCKLTPECISRLNLEVLHIRMNKSYRYRFGHMTNLWMLSVSDGFSQEDISRVNVKSLLVYNCPEITSVNHMSKLEVLSIRGPCGIDDAGIQNVNLRVLIIDGHPNITFKGPTAQPSRTSPAEPVPFGEAELSAPRGLRPAGPPLMSNLEKLSLTGICGVDDDGIKNVNVRELTCDNNPHITNVSHMSKLERLSARGWSGIDNEGIRGVNLKWLDISGNEKITEYGRGTVVINMYCEDSEEDVSYDDREYESTEEEYTDDE